MTSSMLKKLNSMNPDKPVDFYPLSATLNSCDAKPPLNVGVVVEILSDIQMALSANLDGVGLCRLTVLMLSVQHVSMTSSKMFCSLFERMDTKMSTSLTNKNKIH